LVEDEGSGAARETPESDGPDATATPSWLRNGVPEPIDDASRVASATATRPFVARSPLFDPTTQSTRPEVCPFFRAVDDTGSYWPPIEAPDVTNRCIAIGLPKPQSARQQELVCLGSGHVNCPRYLRGALGVVRPASAGVRRSPSTPVAVSALALVLAAATSVGFLLVRGGLSLPIASLDPNVVAVASVAPSPSPTATPVPPSPSPSPSPSPFPSPSPSAAPSATSAPTPAPTATPEPTPEPTREPAPTSDRYALLDRCPNTPNCWIYTVRSGDNLVSIVNWFGVSYDRVLRMNPQIGDPTTIRKGDKIKLPPPTR
jgi:LysM repeat protein